MTRTPKDIAMSRFLRTALPLASVLLATGCAPAAVGQGSSPAETLRAERLEDRVRVTVGGKLFTEYKFADDQKYPYFYPVVGPRSGVSVTTESSNPWPHHHSLFFGSDRVNGGNYWQDGLERGRIDEQETRVEQGEGSAVVITQVNVWSRPGAESPIRDTRRIRITAPSPDVRMIDFDVTLTSLIDVTIEQSNHSLFAARMSPALSVDSGGTLVNAHGDRSEAGTFSKPSPWADYWGRHQGVVEGLAIFNFPENRWSPPPWFTRNYGFFSPTPFNWMEGGKLELPKGRELRLRYRVVVHGGDTSEAGIAELYRRYAEP
jgi:hypothetical protein